MLRSTALRLFAVLLALTASFAAPVQAFAHGYAHSSEATAQQDDGHHSVPDAHGHVVDQATVKEGVDGGAGNHPHAIVSPALVAKVTVPFVATIAPRVVLPPLTFVSAVPPEADITLEPCASQAHAPPPALRAPPAVIG